MPFKTSSSNLLHFADTAKPLGTFGSPSDGDVLQWDSGTGTWVPAAASSSSGVERRLAPTATKTANYTAAAGDLVCYNATAGTFTLRLPASPSDGNRVAIKEVAGSNAEITVHGNGKNLDREASFSLARADAYLDFQFSSSLDRWLVR